MTKSANPQSNPAMLKASSARQPGPYLLVASLAAAASISLLGLMLAAAPTLVRWGLVGQLWYVLLLALGLCAAVLSFALFKSWAGYSGRILGGTLELGGPAVTMLAVVILGFTLAPAPAAPFDVTIFLQPKPDSLSLAQLAHQGRMMIEVGKDIRIEPIGEKAEARFIGVPPSLRNQPAVVRLESTIYELEQSPALIALGETPARLSVRVKMLRLAGIVLGADGQPLAQARVTVADRATTTNGDGRFELAAPANLPDAEKFVAIAALGHRPYRAAVAPGGNPLEVQLERQGR